MTVRSLFNDILIVAVFMLAGFFVLQLIRPLQRLFLPASLIGGLIALILGQQCLGCIEIPESFSAFSNVLIAPIMAALMFGVTISRDRVVGYFDYICVEQGIYGMQMALGTLIGMIFGGIWTGLPTGWGSLAQFAFQGGHGNAAAAGEAYLEYGIEGNISIGMVLATSGLIVAMTFGMIIVNIGVRRGWASYVQDAAGQPDAYYGGPLPEDKRTPVGHLTTSSIAINHLAFQSSWLLIAVLAGDRLFSFLGRFIPVVNSFPSLTYSIVGGALVWNFAKILRLDQYIDVRIIHHISGFLLEVVILTAMATLDLELVSAYIVPILILTLVLAGITILMAFGLSYLFCREEWFEKALMAYGVGTGNTATGLALVRAVDPDSRSDAPDCHGVYSAVCSWKEIFISLIPMWMAGGGGMAVVGIGGLMCGVCVLLGFILFGIPNMRRRKA